MAGADNIRLQIELLETAIKAKKAGLPDDLIVLTYDSTQVEAAKQDVLERFGTTEEVVEAAGSEVIVAAFDWCAGRGVGITDSRDPAIPEAIKESVETFHRGNHVKVVRGTAQQENTESE